ncbi:uncharacterized protein LOC132263341 [Phlebotomus argentipes]|uniref:uncharacterized protein LOC132263341 n=1 Tax=Phlebotomus argentipes TaxID=94469 RepID=UPI0028934A72|nr:uncharacterized protein LOC132263341 [Phlebotomus argentipes]
MSGKPTFSVLESCRLCGRENTESKGRHFLYGIETNTELLTILRSVLPIVIYPEDPLSKWICTGCREHVTSFYGISERFKQYLGKCLDALQKVNKEQTYLQICSDVETFAATLEDSLREKMPSAVFDRHRLVLSKRPRVPEKRTPRQSGEVPSLFKTCIEYINREGKNLLHTYLSVDSAATWSESEIADSDSSMSLDEFHGEEEQFFDSTAMECNVNIVEGYSEQESFSELPPLENGVKKRKLSSRSSSSSERPQTRAKSRINYSEEMIDDALFYEQIMLDEYKRKAKSREKSPFKEEPVYKKRQVAAKSTTRNSIANPLMDIRKQLKTDPTQVIQFNSELSIHLKVKEEPRELRQGVNSSLNTPTTCKFCRKTFPNAAVLSKHQLRHFVLRLKKLDTPEILHTKFRRYSYRFPNFRCCNCLSYFMSKETLKDHWTKGECEFFCRVCRASFHRSRPELHKHYLLVHGVRFNDTIFAVSGLEIDETKMCNVCYCTFPNFQSRNSHMKIHKKKGELILMSPSTSAVPTPRPRLQINQALQMEIKRLEFASHQRFNGMSSSSHMMPPHPMNHRPAMPHMLPPPRFAGPGPMKRFSEAPSSLGDAMGRMYNCIPCGGKFPNKTELYRHKRTCPQLLRTCCHLCWKQFTTTSEFENHMRQHHHA